MLNTWIGMGRLTADPRAGITQNNKNYVSFSIAIDRIPTKDGTKNTDFINCSAWGRTAEVIQKYFTKGKMINVVGNLQNNEYKDRNGNIIKTYQVLVNQVNFCGDSNNNTQQNSYNNYGQQSGYGYNYGQSMVQEAQNKGISTYQQTDVADLSLGDLSGFDAIEEPPF